MKARNSGSLFSAVPCFSQQVRDDDPRKTAPPPKAEKPKQAPSTLKQHECEDTYHRDDRGRELLRVPYEDELAAAMDERSKSFNFTRLPGLGTRGQNGT